MRTAAVAASLAFAALWSSRSASSQPAPAPSPARPTTAQDAGVTGPRSASPLQLSLVRGMEAYRRREHDAALTALREAAGHDGASPVPQLYIGYVHQARGNAASALGAFREALRLATAANDDAHRARALEAIAGTYEAQGQWNEALAAWEEYVAFGDAHASVSFPAVGRARLEAIRRRATLEQEYRPVRERIAERLRVNASGQGSGAQGGNAPR